jgi:hypothetical protein
MLWVDRRSRSVCLAMVIFVHVRRFFGWLKLMVSPVAGARRHSRRSRRRTSIIALIKKSINPSLNKADHLRSVVKSQEKQPQAKKQIQSIAFVPCHYSPPVVNSFIAFEALCSLKY